MDVATDPFYRTFCHIHEPAVWLAAGGVAGGRRCGWRPAVWLAAGGRH